MSDRNMDAGMILVVDDDDSIRELFAEMLKIHGYRVVAARDAAQALDILAAVPIRLMITDHTMPGKTGGRLIQEVRTLYPSVRTMLMSAGLHLEQLARLAGADRYFRKTDPLEDFLTCVYDLVNEVAA